MDSQDDRDADSTYRTYPIIHPPSDLNPCSECQSNKKEYAFFDPNCESCQLFVSHDASISEMFCILRQWTTAVQQSVKTIICQMLDCGAHVNDRDGLTDMTMLHYAVKSGARGMGNVDEACQIVQLMLSRGADPFIRCRWTNMAAIHYAVYFNVHPVLEILLNASKDVDVDSLCCEFDHGTPLHISCRTLALESTVVLLKHGANKLIKDANGRVPSDWLPNADSYEISHETKKTVLEMKKILEQSPAPVNNSTTFFAHTPKETNQITNILKSLDIKIGDKVFVGGVKTGILRYCGPTLFASGFWAGIELDEAIGKNNGSINNIQYFKCPPNYGIFAPISKVSKQFQNLQQTQHNRNTNAITHSRLDLSHITSKIDSGLRQSKFDLSQNDEQKDIDVGDQVLVAGKKIGVVKFVGETQFAPGIWYGIELYTPVGRNDGSVDGVQYFNCPINHGVFAPPFRVQRLHDYTHKTLQRANMFKSPISSISEVPADDDVQHKQLPQNRVKNFNTNTRWSSSITSPTTASNPILTEGAHVFCNGEIGIIHYMGPVDFAEGVWLGVELRTPKGKHDGSIYGKRYFSCRPGHGLLVRPSKVFVRGINGSKLIAAD